MACANEVVTSIGSFLFGIEMDSRRLAVARINQSQVVTKITYTPEDTESTIPKTRSTHFYTNCKEASVKNRSGKRQSADWHAQLEYILFGCTHFQSAMYICRWHTRCVFKRLPIAFQRWGDLGHFGGEPPGNQRGNSQMLCFWIGCGKTSGLHCSGVW